ncbi:hypothetical protein ACFLT2_05500 [Acidobacteriota bacterium]
MKGHKRLLLKSGTVIFLIFLIWILAPVLQAQETQEATEDIPEWRKRPGFSLRFGTYFSSLNTKLRLDSDLLGRGTEIDLEDTLQLDSNPTVFRGDAEIRALSWLSLDFGFHAFKRSTTTVIDEEIQIGDTIFQLNQTVTGKLDTTYLRANLKFYIVNKPRVEFGVWAGANILFLDFSLTAEELGRTLSEEEDVWAPIPAIGIHASYTLFRNFYIFGKGGYFYYGLSDNLKFRSWSFDINVQYYFYKFLGIGATYDFNKFQLDGESDILSGKVMNRFNGIQLYVLIGF